MLWSLLSNSASNTKNIMDNLHASNSSVSPYPGLASFADRSADRSLFFGREKESQALLDMILSENLVLLFARSGTRQDFTYQCGHPGTIASKGLFPGRR